jgi:hypothetical protein
MTELTAFSFVCRLSAICALMFNVRWPIRLSAIGVVLLTQLLFSFTDVDHYPAIIYYGTAATCDLLAIILLSHLPANRFTTDLQLINAASLATNTVGYFMWLCYLSPIYYNSAMLAVLCAQAVRFLWVNNDDRNDLASDHWDSLVWFAHRASPKTHH